VNGFCPQTTGNVGCDGPASLTRWRSYEFGQNDTDQLCEWPDPVGEGHVDEALESDPSVQDRRGELPVGDSDGRMDRLHDGDRIRVALPGQPQVERAAADGDEAPPGSR
jgi:hypothetical protein